MRMYQWLSELGTKTETEADREADVAQPIINVTAAAKKVFHVGKISTEEKV